MTPRAKSLALLAGAALAAGGVGVALWPRQYTVPRPKECVMSATCERCGCRPGEHCRLSLDAESVTCASRPFAPPGARTGPEAPSPWGVKR